MGQVINKVLEKIEEDNPEKLEGIFRSIDFNNEVNLGRTKERNAILKHLLEDFADSRLDLLPSMLVGDDVIGDVYEFLIAHFASDAGKKAGKFFTPSSVSILLAKLVGAKEGDRIYDPACGSGSLLIKAAKEIDNNHLMKFDIVVANPPFSLDKWGVMI